MLKLFYLPTFMKHGKLSEPAFQPLRQMSIFIQEQDDTVLYLNAITYQNYLFLLSKKISGINRQQCSPFYKE